MPFYNWPLCICVCVFIDSNFHVDALPIYFGLNEHAPCCLVVSLLCRLVDCIVVCVCVCVGGSVTTIN